MEAEVGSTVNLPPPVCLDPRASAAEDWATGGGAPPGGGAADAAVILTPTSNHDGYPEQCRDVRGWPTPRLGAPPECKPKTVVRVCARKATKIVSQCSRLSCNRCQNILRARRARAFAARLQRAVDAGKAIIYLILTVPEHRREAAADPKTWSKWLRAIWAHLKKRHGASYGCQRTDPAGDESPTKWHPHANFLIVKKDGRGWMDVEEIKEAWGEIVGAQRNLFGRAIIDVRIKYADALDQRLINHWYDYQGRTWAAWRESVPKHLNVRWYGPRKEFKLEKVVDPLCPCCGARPVYIRCKYEIDADELVAIAEARSPADAVQVAWARGWTDHGAPGGT